jgi:nitrite reductase/ring-hydroxylating ferredoxin subunit
MEPPEGVTDAGASGDYPEGEMRRVLVGTIPALVVRRGGVLHAIGAVCSHAGGPLDEGTLDGDVVTCPWHGSRFCIRDGRVLGGPATFPEPAFDVQETDGRVTIGLPSPAQR